MLEEPASREHLRTTASALAFVAFWLEDWPYRFGAWWGADLVAESCGHQGRPTLQCQCNCPSQRGSTPLPGDASWTETVHQS